MEMPQQAYSTDMVKFLLAFCCGDKLSDTHHDVQALNERLEECWRNVVPVANSPEMRKRLYA